MEKTIIGGMMAIVMVAVMAQFVQAAAPQPQYICPICGQKFMTYDQLYQHFTAEHPSEPIEVIWTD
jgi:hypothetical protein